MLKMKNKLKMLDSSWRCSSNKNNTNGRQIGNREFHCDLYVGDQQQHRCCSAAESKGCSDGNTDRSSGRIRVQSDSVVVVVLNDTVNGFTTPKKFFVTIRKMFKFLAGASSHQNWINFIRLLVVMRLVSSVLCAGKSLHFSFHSIILFILKQIFKSLWNYDIYF